MTKLGVIRDLQAQGVAIYDNSMLSAWLNCPRMFYYKHIHGLAPVTEGESTPLHFGLSVHSALEEWYGSKDNQKALKVFVESFSPYEEKSAISPKTGKELGATYTVLYGCSILTEYFRRYADDKRAVIQLETPIAEELTDGVFMAGRIDKIVKGPRGYVFVDYKTTKYINDFQLNPNPQFMTYKWLSEQLTGEKVTGELDIIGVSKSKGVSELLRREPFDYSPYQMSNWMKSCVYLVQQIEKQKSHNFFPQTWKCKPFFRNCDYVPLCTLPTDGAEEKLIKTLYTQKFWDPFSNED